MSSANVKLPIFMDNHSTTQVDPRVVETMVPYFTTHFGNAASRNHAFGWTAEAAVEHARAQVAALIGGDGKEIVWTSGATESNNVALKGAASFYKKQGNHIITVETEHKSVLDTPAKRLQREGYEVTYLRPQKDGIVTPEMITAAMTEHGDKTLVVSVMLANNEIGVVQDVNAIGAAIKAKNPKTLFHIDGVQGAGKIPFDVELAKADLVSLSAHKLYGPARAIWLRKPWVRRKPRVRIDPLIDGGGHERGMRSGTLAVPLIVAFLAAPRSSPRTRWRARRSGSRHCATGCIAASRPSSARPTSTARWTRGAGCPATSTSRSRSSRASRS